MNLAAATLAELRTLLDTKKISSSELVDFFRARIEKHNPKLNVYLTVCDPESAAGTGPLAGIPLAIKDNFCTKGIRTTASAKLLDSFISPYDATVISRLKEAGALVQGKTNMDAWAHGSSTETSDYGPTLNPWDTTRVPGGSSGGSAAATAAALAPAAIGSETAGSIRGPASWCGVIGVKPTYGRVSRYGVIAMGSSLDCPGPFSRTIEDSALLLQIIAGKDPFDATSAEEAVPDYTAEMKKKRTFTIGIADEYLEGVQEDVRKNFDQTKKELEKMGHTFKKISLIPPKYSISVYTILQRAEVSSNLSRYDGIRYGEKRTAFTAEAKRRIMLGTYTLSHGYYDAYYKKAQQVRTLLIEDFRRVFRDVDLIMAPSGPVTALKLGEFEKYPFFGEIMDVLYEPGAIAGLPAISIPTGLDSNSLPIGMQFMANYFSEGALLDIGYQYEQETGFHGISKQLIDRYA
ncbi:MAG: Asp-tRNA(Asn)/Glu-tRNA(Gln) amidotransferase subunit GatA [Patescibacteria group bacterium]|nr:Asp-tRNA(Asn)/Glu-tRNA(Gln) amidotransferase subunit GatA [Patescibacteria group bacterium]